jgi:diacylglycerol O-acyltransferase / wax synthase
MGMVRDAIEARLDHLPRLRQVIRIPRRGGGGPFWADAANVDLARHIRERRLEPPVGEAELLRAVEQLRALQLDPQRPLWEIWLLTGLPDEKVGLFVKIHHSIADGLAAMTIVSAFLDTSPAGSNGPLVPWRPVPGPRPSDLVADNMRRRIAAVGRVGRALAHPLDLLRRLVTAGPAMREILAEQPGDPTSIDRIVGDARTYALVRGGYRTVKSVARTCDASVNDILLAVTAAGLRALLVARGEPVEGVTLRTYVPVSLRRSLHGPQQGTQIAQMVVPLSMSAASPIDRLRQIAADTRRRKAMPRPPIGALFRGPLASKLLLKLVVAQRVNITTASIPGPRRPLFLAGAEVLEAFPLLPLVGNEPLGVGALSYAGTWGIGIAADREAFPDIDIFAAAVRDELTALGGRGSALGSTGGGTGLAPGGPQCFRRRQPPTHRPCPPICGR